MRAPCRYWASLGELVAQPDAAQHLRGRVDVGGSWRLRTRSRYSVAFRVCSQTPFNAKVPFQAAEASRIVAVGKSLAHSLVAEVVDMVPGLEMSGICSR